MTRPDRLSLKTRVRPGRGAPRAMPAPDGDANSHAAVSSSLRRVEGAGPAPPPSTGRHSHGARPPRGPAGMVD